MNHQEQKVGDRRTRGLTILCRNVGM
jgi:hypothetical protein